jgi:hypothetical protein
MGVLILYENLNRELKFLSIFSAMLLIGAVVYLVWVLSPTPSPKISPTPKAIVKHANFTVHFPKVPEIQSLDIASDGAGSMWMVPNDPRKTITQVLNWLKTEEPVSVQLPQSKSKKQWLSSGYRGPSTLYLHLKDKEIITITPAYFIWVTNTGFYYHYLNATDSILMLLLWLCSLVTGSYNTNN